VGEKVEDHTEEKVEVKIITYVEDQDEPFVEEKVDDHAEEQVEAQALPE